MTDTKIIRIAGVALIGALMLFTIALFLESRPAFASAPPGLPTSVATTSTILVGPSKVHSVGTTTDSIYPVLFTANQGCNSRIISTAAQPIMISFDAMSSTSISGSFGAVQAASTTVSYDSGLYGCGLWSAYGGLSSTTILLVETR